MPNFTGLWTAAQQSQADGAGIWPNVSGAPTIGTATVASGTSASVTFTAPAYAGYPATITGYIVTSSPEGLTGTGASSPVSVTGLTTGTAYTFTVRAINATGTGPSSAASNSVTPVNTFVEEVFSTFTYTGNSSTQTITNDIDLSTKGGLIWFKERTTATGGQQNHQLFDTARGANSRIFTSLTNAESTAEDLLQSFNSNGFTLHATNSASLNYSASTYCSWTFRKQPKFFDIVTWTGNSTSGRQIPHSLGSAPGFVIVKRTSNANNWICWHRALTSTQYIQINNTSEAQSDGGIFWNSTIPDATNLTLGNDSGVNGSGSTYVAYLFAHDAGGFGLTGTDNVISCGSYTGTGALQTINLGYEAQFVMIKKTSGVDDWYMFDVMRGFVVCPASGNTPTGDADAALRPNTSAVEQVDTWGIDPAPNGFTVRGNNVSPSGGTYIYIAIRRGPMKVPTVGTTVFAPVTRAGTGANTSYSVGFPADLITSFNRAGGYRPPFVDRLRGVSKHLLTDLTNAEATNTVGVTAINSTSVSLGVDTSFYYWNESGQNYINYAFRRAPSFFDEVCYTGTGSATTVTHNLAAVPELIITKTRTSASGYNYWFVYHKDIGQTFQLLLNGTNARDDGWGSPYTSTPPTSSVFSISSGIQINESGVTHVSYLFATCSGVSKVGSYTGTATTKQIDCGFTAGARYVLIKRTDSTGDWYVWDSARGIISGNDPYNLINSSSAEVTNTDYIDTYSLGFELSSTAPAAINASGGTYIFLAIA